MAKIFKYYGPPGTGKTSTLMNKVKEEISNGIHPSEITYCSFTRSASYHARDLALQEYPNYTKEDFRNFATIHSICYRLLGLTPHAVFAHKQIQEFTKAFSYHFSEGIADDMFKQVLTDMTLSTDADHYENFVSWQKNMMLWGFDEAYKVYCQRQVELPRDFSRHALELYLERREQYKQREGLWDFGDMLTAVVQRGLHPDSSIFFLDEAQDNSKLLFEVAKLWASQAERVYIAGDPYQAIYTFAAADPNLIIDFKADETITLKEGFRCSKAVYKLARKLVERLKTRYTDDDFLPTQSDGQVSKVSLPNISFDGNGTTFCLFRTRYLMEGFYEHLLNKGIPFTVRRGKHSPLDKSEKEAVYHLYRLAEGGSITLGELNKLVKFIPQQSYLKRGAKAEITERAKDNPDHRISMVSLPALGFTTDFVHLLDTGEYTETLKLSPEEKRYYRLLLKNYGASALIDEPKVQLGTIHSFKGLEADNVVLDLSLTRLPYENLLRNPDEEMRVLYTGITRAKTKVDLLVSDNWRCFPL